MLFYQVERIHFENCPNSICQSFESRSRSDQFPVENGHLVRWCTMIYPWKNVIFHSFFLWTFARGSSSFIPISQTFDMFELWTVSKTASNLPSHHLIISRSLAPAASLICRRWPMPSVWDPNSPWLSCGKICQKRDFYHFPWEIPWQIPGIPMVFLSWWIWYLRFPSFEHEPKRLRSAEISGKLENVEGVPIPVMKYHNKRAKMNRCE